MTKPKAKQKRRPTLAPLDVRQRYSIPESAQYLRISQAYLWQLIQAGRVQVIREGSDDKRGRVFISGQTIADRSAPPAQLPSPPAAA